MHVALQPRVHGWTEPAFAPVREAFQRNFTEHGELGAAVAVHHRGRLVADLWAGVRDQSTGAPWESDTLAIVFSATKGVTSMVLAHAHSRGLFCYERPVADYWPEFAQHGKEHVTVRELLSHRAGLPYLDVELSPALLADHDRLAEALAAQSPVWAPGTRHGYHSVTIGLYAGELLRRVDGRTVGTYLAEELAGPLGLDLYVGLPEDIDPDRLAPMAGGTWRDLAADPTAVPLGHVLARSLPWTTAARTFANPPLKSANQLAGPDYRSVELPHGNGFATARSLAVLYGEFAQGSPVLGVGQDSLRALEEQPTEPSGGERDVNLKVRTRYSLGLWKPFPGWRFGSDGRAYGTPGAGGSFGFADPATGTGYGYVPNRMGLRIWDDPRDVNLREALVDCLRSATNDSSA
ncbi:beta-lactamase family protein [Nocardiopsis exhalans]|uniref:Beta-lactamase family protein n=1 Tax=Nocardiopsis exhalans TaxID=163604 RepID=A0ABY5CZE7_9ACTN|nr:serine hydrolase domain-containing protein [Nocardiopsis exhalans]USY17179.1 beta-lactamase family protein [Nocardiopsis exhalans]